MKNLRLFFNDAELLTDMASLSNSKVLNRSKQLKVRRREQSNGEKRLMTCT